MIDLVEARRVFDLLVAWESAIQTVVASRRAPSRLDAEKIKTNVAFLKNSLRRAKEEGEKNLDSMSDLDRMFLASAISKAMAEFRIKSNLSPAHPTWEACLNVVASEFSYQQWRMRKEIPELGA